MGRYEERYGWDCVEFVVGWSVSGRPDPTESSRSMAVLRVFAGFPCSPPAPRNISRPPYASVAMPVQSSRVVHSNSHILTIYSYQALSYLEPELYI
jgi:hypothetical protein